MSVLSNRRLELTFPLPPHVRVIGGAPRMPPTMWMHTAGTRLLHRMRADVVHFTNGWMPFGGVSPTPAVITIRDVSVFSHPELHARHRVLLQRSLLGRAVRHARAVIVPSRAVRHELLRQVGVDDGRVHVVAEAAAPQFHPMSDVAWLDETRRRHSLGDRFVLHVGRAGPRKNLRLLIEAFARRATRGDLTHQLVCVGPYGRSFDEVASHVERLGIENRVRLTGYVPIQDLVAMYNLADMLVVPSICEGFGLPVVEAMACGTPVITGPAPALVEVGGDAVERVASLDVESLGEAIVRMARCRERREQLRVLGRRRAARFSWQRAARETLDIYRGVSVGARPAVQAAARSLTEALPDVVVPGVAGDA